MEDVRGQMILIFAAIVVVVVLTLSYVYAQNIIAGVESSRTMLAYPKEEIRNLEEIYDEYKSDPNLTKINDELRILCAKNGWVCYISPEKVEFKTVEVEYCGGPGC